MANLEWIEQAGGVNRAAAAIAPAIRGLFAGGKPLQVVFSAEQDKKADIHWQAAEFTALDDVYSRLRSTAAIPQKPQSITIEGLGSYKLKTDIPGAGKRLDGRVCLVTGAAQGFGEGIARELAAAGAVLVIADLNIALAETVAGSLNDTWGAGTAIALKVDVSQEESVQNLVDETVLAFGGLDLLVSNAGVLRAGGLEEMTLQNFEFVTRINYTAFFLVTKYGSRPMKLQARFAPDYAADIVQVNSKSGLEGSNKNFAYAGGKFGGIGLVQSFAKELVEDRVKVNAVCPGNFYEGPLWSDPERGLFVQYLKAGKVPGAKTVDDVYQFYVAKVPMRRGCSPLDVTRAILYCVEQRYETGQAIPVTGGQNMLK
ncbi:MAG: SDR family NAD(P)-dependent oxidoreductase [Clostridiaceae bacterium]|nr:SDR family NAD(P)-dependent oxidoreductase [Clostridiaceae bacterium]